MKDKLVQDAAEVDVDVSFELERQSEAGIAKHATPSSLISDSEEDDDESYVPESLRNFFKEADRKLEADLSFLSPPEPSTVLAKPNRTNGFANEVDEDGDPGNSLLADDLEREMQKAQQRDLERKAAMERESEDRRERERKQVEQDELKQQRERKQRLEAFKAAKQQAAKVLEVDDGEKAESLLNIVNPSDEYDNDDDDIDADENNMTSPLLDIINPSADVSERHLKQIAMEGDQEEEETALQPLVAMVEGSASNPPAASPMVNGGAALTSATKTPKSQAQVESFPSPSPQPTKVGRKLQMELDAEAHRASLTPQRALLTPGSLSLDGSPKRTPKSSKPANQQKQQESTDMEIDGSSDNHYSNNNINSSVAVKAALEEKQKSMREKQERLKELQSRSVERKQRLKKLEDKAATEKLAGRKTPSTAAAAAAAAANNHTNRSMDKEPVALPDASPAAAKKSLTGPVKSLPTHQRRVQQKKTPQKWSFRARDAPSPPRPKEINFSVDGGARSVSPLGGVDPAMSPLSSPRAMRRPATSNSNRRSIQPRALSLQNDDDKPKRPSPSKRRQLTRPDSTFDRLSRPTASSRSARVGGAAPSKPQTKINPEEEQRKARERIRKRMAVQRKKAKSSNEGMNDGTANHLSAAAKKANERKERIERMEKERLEKIKAKIEAREERLQLKKKEEAQKNKQRLKQRAALRQNNKQPPVSGSEVKSTRTTPQHGQPALTIPVAPKFATDRRLASTGKKAPPKERLSLASQASMFGRGLRAPTPPAKRPTETPEPRRLTIPLAPKLATSRRLGDKAAAKSTPFASPSKKPRDISDTVSWTSMLRDVSDIGSPLSKAASSVKTGPLTIPVTPHFQPIRKRPLPKSTAEREKEEMEYFKEHPFKARMVKMNEPLSSARPKKVPPKRKLTTPEPFHFHSTRSAHKRDFQEAKEDEVTSFKAMPMPNFSSKKPPASKKFSPSPRPLTTPEPFRFHTTSSSKRSHIKSEEESTGTGEKFKALPMPDFKKSNRTSMGSRKKSPRALTMPEPFHFHSTSSKRSYAKSEEESTGAQFKAMPMPDFKSSRNSLGSKKLRSPPTRPLTTPEPFKFHGHVSSRKTYENKDAEKPFKARKMPNFETAHRKSPPVKEPQRKTRDKRPTGASGLLFHRSFTASSRLSRPRVAKEPPKHESKPFKARPMPGFIPEVIVTRTPIKDGDEEVAGRAYEIERELDHELDSILSDSQNFQARPMPNFDKPDIPVKDKLPNQIRTPSPKTKEGEMVSSPAFKASPAPKNMLDEPSIPVRRRNPNKLRSPDSVQKPSPSPKVPKSPVFKARPVPDSLYDEPTPIRGIRTTNRSTPSPSRKTNSNLNTPVNSPPRVHRDEEVNGANVMEDAKARLRERLSTRRSNAAAVKAATPNRDNRKKTNAEDEVVPITTSPKAFSTLRVQSLLTSQSEALAKRGDSLLQKSKNLASAASTLTENTPRKSNVPKSIDLPVRSDNNSSTPKENKDGNTPRVANVTEDKEAALLRETKLALALGLPDGDESSSILQLAKDVQKAAEDELSFYGSVDTRDHWSSSLADGRPMSLLDTNNNILGSDSFHTASSAR